MTQGLHDHAFGRWFFRGALVDIGMEIAPCHTMERHDQVLEQVLEDKFQLNVQLVSI